MLSVIIPTEGVEQPAVATLAALVPGAAAGVIREVLLVDRAGTGVIERVADVAGCRFLAFEGSRAAALAAGARHARSPWLMFLHAGAVLDSGWIEETAPIHPERLEQRPAARRRLPLRPLALCRYAAARRLQIRRADDHGPSADQGLLIARDHYERLGGYPPMRAAPRRGCCANSGARRAPSCAAGSWSSPEAVHRRAGLQNIENNPMQSRSGIEPGRFHGSRLLPQQIRDLNQFFAPKASSQPATLLNHQHERESDGAWADQLPAFRASFSTFFESRPRLKPLWPFSPHARSARSPSIR